MPGDKCLWCEEAIEPDDITTKMPTDVPGDGWQLRRIHQECQLRSMAGSVGHIKGTCSCYGGEGNGDPPGLTKREAALAAWEELHHGKWELGSTDRTLIDPGSE